MKRLNNNKLKRRGRPIMVGPLLLFLLRVANAKGEIISTYELITLP
jgi:hypothetical protein